MPFGNTWMTYSLDHTPIVHTHTFIWRQSLYDNLVPLRSNPKMARSLHVILLTPTTAKLKEITPWVHITQLKKIMQPNDENACQTNTYQVSHKGPTTLKFSQLPLAATGDGWACPFPRYNYSWNNFWQLSGSWVLKHPCSNTLKITSPPCGYKKPFITFTPLKSNSFLSYTHFPKCCLTSSYPPFLLWPTNSFKILTSTIYSGPLI